MSTGIMRPRPTFGTSTRHGAYVLRGTGGILADQCWPKSEYLLPDHALRAQLVHAFVLGVALGHFALENSDHGSGPYIHLHQRRDRR